MNGTMVLTDEFSARMTGGGLFSFSWGKRPGLNEGRRETFIGKGPAAWIDFIFPVEKQMSTCQSTEVFLSQWEAVFTPRTDLGRTLYALRAKAVADGMRLLSEEEVLEEVKRRRGEIEGNEKDLY